MLGPRFAFEQRTANNGNQRPVGTKLSALVDKNAIPISVSLVRRAPRGPGAVPR